MKRTCRRIDEERVAKRNVAGETPQEERNRKRVFDQWLKKQPMPSSRCFAMANYGSIGRPLTW